MPVMSSLWVKGRTIQCPYFYFMFDELINHLFPPMWVNSSGTALGHDGLRAVYRKKEFRDKIGSYFVLPVLPRGQTVFLCFLPPTSIHFTCPVLSSLPASSMPLASLEARLWIWVCPKLSKSQWRGWRVGFFCLITVVWLTSILPLTYDIHMLSTPGSSYKIRVYITCYLKWALFSW